MLPEKVLSSTAAAPLMAAKIRRWRQCHCSLCSASSCAMRSSSPAPVSWTPSEAKVAESTVPDTCCSSTKRGWTSARHKPLCFVLENPLAQLRWRLHDKDHTT